MAQFTDGARRLPPHHITIRVPWHDNGWNGTVCRRPLDNSSCLILPNIGEGRIDSVEERCAGQRLEALAEGELPPCIGERSSFMSDFELSRTMKHPYSNGHPETHGHFAPTRFVQPPYSAACVPFRWMLLEEVAGEPKNGEIGLAERLRIRWVPEREPEIRDRNGRLVETSWLQQRDNQLALLDTFFGALRPQESLCFFYAKSTPLSEQSRRVIVGVGRVLSVGESKEYVYEGINPPLRSAIWERNIGHSIRPNFADGFLFPYQEVLELSRQVGLDPEEFLAFAPDDYFSEYSYGSELLTHDGAVASLISCVGALQRVRSHIEGPWDRALMWVDSQLNRLWEARGAYPGLGSALSAFGYEWGFQHGSLLAYEIELLRERHGTDDPWVLVDAVMEDPKVLGGPVQEFLTSGMRNGWKQIAHERRELLQLLARCAISEKQALRFFDHFSRKKAGITTSDSELIANPYLIFELDRRLAQAVAFGTIDRGVFPDAAIRQKLRKSEPSTLLDPADPRRVRALTVDLLEEAAVEGHTLLPRDWLISRARDRALRPPCPLGESVLDVSGKTFAPMVAHVETREGGPAYQMDRLASCREIIRREVLGRMQGRKHSGEHNWRELVEAALDRERSENGIESLTEQRARREKAEALEATIPFTSFRIGGCRRNRKDNPFGNIM